MTRKRATNESNIVLSFSNTAFGCAQWKNLGSAGAQKIITTK